MTDISNLHLLAASGSSIVAELADDEELQKRLSLYEVFLRLYKHNSSLLDKILQLEDISSLGEKQQYIQAIENDGAVYIITNLCDGKTQSLQQPQQIWTIGRDRCSGIHVLDRYVSRRHGAIQYIQKKGFYLIDFGSTNGSYINDKQIYQPTKLKDGDRIRLGNITFSFFINLSTQVLPTVAVELLMQLIPKRNSAKAASHNYYSSKTKTVTDELKDISRISKNIGILKQESCPISRLEQQLSAHQKSEILDYFFNRHSSASSPIEE
ncbi:MAG: FHA domain-containing protein [Cyanobacteria bacterium P01_A01_bin.84]